MKIAILSCAVLLLWGCKPSGSKTEVEGTPVPPTAAAIDAAVAPTVKPILVDGVLSEPDSDAPLITVTRTAISLDGAVVEKIESGGDPMAASFEGLNSALATLLEKRPAKTVRVLLDPAVDYRTMFRVFASAQKSGARSFELLASKNGKVGSIPIVLPDYVSAGTADPCDLRSSDQGGASLSPAIDALRDKKPAQKPKPAKKPQMKPCPDLERVQLILSIPKPGEALLWSMSGLEGTLQKPKLKLYAAEAKRVEDPAGVAASQRQKVQTALAGILERRWVKEKRGEREMILQCASELSAEETLRWIAALRHSSDGKPLFSNVLLSIGFE